jgi:lysophospholipase L1-like esterase
MLILMRLRVARVSILASAGLLTLGAQTGDQGRPRTDQNSRTAHEQLLEKARRGGIDLYFAGDSITRRWGTSDTAYREFFENWRRNFFGWNAGNFGWGGDTIQNILWRLENGELDGVHPKVVVLLGGTNNLRETTGPGAADALVEEVTQGIATCLRVIREKAPDATTILMGITPRNGRDGNKTFMPLIDRINERLSTMTDGRKIRYLNINAQLADRDGKLVEGVTADGLHLSERGYQIWANALKPILMEVLGPPAVTDHAPPPTGDPSARTAVQQVR